MQAGQRDDGLGPPESAYSWAALGPRRPASIPLGGQWHHSPLFRVAAAFVVVVRKIVSLSALPWPGLLMERKIPLCL